MQSETTKSTKKQERTERNNKETGKNRAKIGQVQNEKATIDQNNLKIASVSRKR